MTNLKGTIEAQLELEKEMLHLGVQRYQSIVNNAVQKGREGGTSYGARLISEFTQPLADAIDTASITNMRGTTSVATSLLKGVSSRVAAFICIKTVMDGISQQAPAAKLLVSLGTKLEDEMRFTAFNEAHEAYFATVLQDFKDKNTQSYRHMHAVLTKKANDMEDGWNAWTSREKLLVGTFLVDLMISTTDLVQKIIVREGKKRIVLIAPTAAAEAWIHTHMEEMEVLRPDFLPCHIPPVDWTAQQSGGYYTPELQRRLQFVKIKDAQHRKVIKGHNFDIHMHGVNILQQTSWRVNTKVHDVIKDIWINNLGVGLPATEPYKVPKSPYHGMLPGDLTAEQTTDLKLWKREASNLYRMETERVAQLISLSRTMSLAKRYRDFEEFYYVYNCDFRGRTYCATTGMSPQGADFGKGLLQFATGLPIKDGHDHLAIHGANTYGVDKASYKDRVKWIKDNEFAILLSATDPLCSNSKQFWGNADKPFQFLAFCIEWADYSATGFSNTFITRLPCAADGSCNGLQNFSALLRDPVGAGATNLLDCEVPADIYQQVADVSTEKLRGYTDEYAAEWLRITVSRKITKKPVMTLPYGSTMSSCTDSIEEWLYTNPTQHTWVRRDVRKAAMFLAKVIWESIGEVVIAAREAMDWLRSASRVASRHNNPLIWTSPTGFKIYQGSKKFEVERVTTKLCGGTKFSLAHATDEIDPYRQANGASPNFIHGNDAAHMIMTAIESNTHGITSFAMIHDDFGTHAPNMDLLHKAIRTQFVIMYSKGDLLQRFVDENTIGFPYKFKELPTTGTFDINEVLTSDYFFG
jgi:DNA-directed RNA polymerase